MHLASEVSSTTNHHSSPMEGPAVTSRHQNTKSKSNKNTSNGTASQKISDAPTHIGGMLTAESLAERTIDGLLAEHPGELVRTGSPHIVS